MDTRRDELIHLLLEKSVRFGEFILASGARSDFYVDVREVSFHSRGSYLLGTLLLDRIKPEVQAVGGVALGAVPLVSSVVLAEQFLAGYADRHGFAIRKDPKGYGTRMQIAGSGNLKSGMKVAILEDVTTTGDSMFKAIKAAEEFGLVVVQCLTVVDREEGAVQALQHGGYELEALVTRTNLSVAS